MNANKQEKITIVKEIVKKLQVSKALVVADYKGVTVKQFQELRKRLKEKDVEIKVYKNRLFKIAAKEVGAEKLETSLVGPNVFAFGMSDDISPAKVMAIFANEFKILKMKSGIFEGNVIDADGVNEVAILPTFEEALTKLATQLIAPIKFIGVGLNELIEGNHLNVSGSKEKAVKAPTKKVEIKEPKEEAPIKEIKAKEKTTKKIVEKEGE